MVSIIILNYNGKQFLETCLTSVINADYSNFEVIFVDNGSTDGSIGFVKERFGKNPRLKIFRNKENLGFAEGNNVGVKYTSGEYIVFLNNDTEVDPKWLKELINVVKSDDHRIGAAQSKLLLMDDRKRIDCAGGFIDHYGYANERGHGQIDKGQYDKIEEIFYAKGAGFIVRRKILKEVGLFDPKSFMYYDETDLCWRIWLRGYRIVFVPKSIVYHAAGSTISRIRKPVKRYFLTRNQMTTLIKNYNSKNVLKYLAVFITLELRKAVLLMFRRDLATGIATIKALSWNLFNLKYVWKKRQEVQLLIRKVPDAMIMRKVMLKPYPPYPQRLIFPKSHFPKETLAKPN